MWLNECVGVDCDCVVVGVNYGLFGGGGHCGCSRVVLGKVVVSDTMIEVAVDTVGTNTNSIMSEACKVNCFPCWKVHCCCWVYWVARTHSAGSWARVRVGAWCGVW